MVPSDFCRCMCPSGDVRELDICFVIKAAHVCNRHPAVAPTGPSGSAFPVCTTVFVISLNNSLLFVALGLVQLTKPNIRDFLEQFTIVCGLPIQQRDVSRSLLFVLAGLFCIQSHRDNCVNVLARERERGRERESLLGLCTLSVPLAQISRSYKCPPCRFSRKLIHCQFVTVLVSYLVLGLVN